MQNDKTVTKYFDIICNVIFHWFGKHEQRRGIYGKRDNGGQKEEEDDERELQGRENRLGLSE